jgi:hypothetical protein
MTIIQVRNQSAPAARPARQRCDRCGGPFGLVTHRWWGSKFCTRGCKEGHIRQVMVNRGYVWNRSRGLRTVACVVLFLSFFASFSALEAWYCGQPFDVQAAPIRWANARQTRPRAEEPDQICRAYGNQFYEAVQARQAVSECAEAGHQKEIEFLDAEIEAFNNLIATYCGT